MGYSSLPLSFSMASVVMSHATIRQAAKDCKEHSFNTCAFLLSYGRHQRIFEPTARQGLQATRSEKIHLFVIYYDHQPTIHTVSKFQEIMMQHLWLFQLATMVYLFKVLKEGPTAALDAHGSLRHFW